MVVGGCGAATPITFPTSRAARFPAWRARDPDSATPITFPTSRAASLPTLSSNKKHLLHRSLSLPPARAAAASRSPIACPATPITFPTSRAGLTVFPFRPEPPSCYTDHFPYLPRGAPPEVLAPQTFALSKIKHRRDFSSHSIVVTDSSSETTTESSILTQLTTNQAFYSSPCWFNLQGIHDLRQDSASWPTIESICLICFDYSLDLIASLP